MSEEGQALVLPSLRSNTTVRLNVLYVTRQILFTLKTLNEKKKKKSRVLRDELRNELTYMNFEENKQDHEIATGKVWIAE